ncbi:MAG: hypothetical protein HKN47_16760 [Pirellulaceae bacterium]|nr:hypothetical protein [Pirellulaceae bacterium]
MHLHNLRRLAYEIILGDDCTSTMNYGQRNGWENRSPLARFHADEGGKISYISIFTMLTFLVIVVFVTNTGITARHKIQLQNAADATAYSTGIWQARSLNAITSANHLMGELTAITVTLDSFGGKMMAAGESNTTDESKDYNEKLKDLEKPRGIQEGAPISKTYGVSGKFLNVPDQAIVSAVYKMMSSDKGKHYAGAAIYDAKLTLKFCAYIAFWVKDKANYLLMAADVLYKTGILAWAGAIVEAAAVAIHVLLSYKLVRIGMEWAWLHATELALRTIQVGGALRRGIVDVAIPTISMYPETIIDAPLGSIGIGQSRLGVAVRQTQDQLRRHHRLTAAKTYPAWDEITVPVVKEPPPAEQGSSGNSASPDLGPWEHPTSLWSDDFTSGEMKILIDQYRKVKNIFNDIIGQIDTFLGPLLDAVDKLTDAWDSAVDTVKGWFSKKKKLTPEQQRKKREAEQKQREAEVAEEKFEEIKNVVRGAFADAMPQEPPEHPEPWPENPCIDPNWNKEELKLPEFYWQAEQNTQWVRGTYPYVDEFRAPIISFFQDKCEMSDAATYFSHWSNRYTLANSYEIRGGSANGSGSGSILPTPYMFVLQDMEPKTKGQKEPWLTDDDYAEELFCVTSYVSRAVPKVIGQKIFEHSNNDDRFAIASALVYNANGRDVGNSPDEAQPNTGWDTLNWQPPVQAREWGNHKPSQRSDLEIWDIFTSRKPQQRNRVRVNWQVKLVPLTEKRMGEVADEEPELEEAVERFDLFNH